MHNLVCRSWPYAHGVCYIPLLGLDSLARGNVNTESFFENAVVFFMNIHVFCTHLNHPHKHFKQEITNMFPWATMKIHILKSSL